MFALHNPTGRYNPQFIQAAVKHPGSLHRFAAKHHALTATGRINLNKAHRAAERLPQPARTHRLKQIAFAHTLAKFRARK